jgi:hypothetical protein
MKKKNKEPSNQSAAVSGFDKYDGIALSLKSGRGKIAVDFHLPDVIHDEDVHRFMVYLDEIRFRLLTLTTVRLDQFRK